MKKQFVLCLMCMLAVIPNVKAEPTLRYKNAGSFGTWTEESYFSSPVVSDLDGDGKKEIIFSNYSITVLNEKDGSVKWKVNSGLDMNTPF